MSNHRSPIFRLPKSSPATVATVRATVSPTIIRRNAPVSISRVILCCSYRTESHISRDQPQHYYHAVAVNCRSPKTGRKRARIKRPRTTLRNHPGTPPPTLRKQYISATNSFRHRGTPFYVMQHSFTVAFHFFTFIYSRE